MARQLSATGTLPRLALPVIVVPAAILLFWGLTEKDLWQDEAATAVLATRMLKFGRPVAYDGVNLLTIDIIDKDDDAAVSRRTGDPKAAVDYFSRRGDFKPDSTWKWQPWGLFALAAVSIKALGQTTLAARLPFALAGLATVALLFRLVRRHFDSVPMAALSAVLLACNTYWVLHARQCRYYSVSSLFLVLTVMAYARWQREGRGAVWFIAASWCWFQMDYGTVLPVLGVLFLDAALAERRAPWRTLRIGLILSATLAPFVYFYDLLHRGSVQDGTWMDRFQLNLFNMNEYVVPMAVVLTALLLLARRWRSHPPAERRLVGVASAIVLAIALWIPTVAGYSFLRYTIMVAPMGALLTSWLVVQMVQKRTRLVWAAGALIVFTPWLSMPLRAFVTPPAAWHGGVWWRTELHDLGSQVFGHQPDPNRLVIDWLRKNAAPTDEILINYEDFPLMYYLPNPIRGGLATFRVEDDAKTLPRFVVLRFTVSFGHWPVYVREVKRYSWEPVPLAAPDVPWGNNPDPFASVDSSRVPNLYFARRVDQREP